jgi:hypothetical protein
MENTIPSRNEFSNHEGIEIELILCRTESTPMTIKKPPNESLNPFWKSEEKRYFKHMLMRIYEIWNPNRKSNKEGDDNDDDDDVDDTDDDDIGDDFDDD